MLVVKKLNFEVSKGRIYKLADFNFRGPNFFVRWRFTYFKHVYGELAENDVD